MNLIDDAWIPVRMKDGTRRVIAPWAIADPQISAPDWPRADLNLACYELLIGLVFMACPPRDLKDWRERRLEPDSLRAALAPFAPAFNLLGDAEGKGPRFAQDLEELLGEPSSADLLFIDSSGGNTVKNNADLMVHRDRYPALDLPLAAMALYTFQQFAPAGGAGNRTSMRGGGPMVTLANPGTGLRDLVWANVPFGTPADVVDLPWMRPTRTSEKGQTVEMADAALIEAFFGMPRRLRLVSEGGQVTGVIQRPYGTNYGLWRHPLSPYYRMKPGSEPLPKHPASGQLPYRNWAGVVLSEPAGENSLRLRASCIHGYYQRYAAQPARMIVAGWAMSNMKPIDFLWSELPLLPIDDDAQSLAQDLIAAANTVRLGLGSALAVVTAEGSAREAQADQFWTATEGDFVRALAALADEAFDPEPIARSFLDAIGRQALAQFDALALPGLSDGKIERAEKIVKQRGYLAGLVLGWSKQGAKLWDGLGIEPPERKKQEVPA